MNALFEWRQAARWAGYKWEEFGLLDGEAQSAIIAQYQTHHQIEAVLEKERIRAMKEAQRRQGQK